jgi:GGDEF domain-containing protein
LRIRNVAEEAGERLKSVAAQTRLSEFPPIDTSNDPPTALIAGAPGPIALAAIAACADIAERCDAALSAGQAMRALEAGFYDCAVFIPRNSGDPLLGLARTMRRHYRFQDMPIIVVHETATSIDFNVAPNAEFIDARHLSADLPARLVVLARRARLLAAMRRFLRACAGDGVKDRLSGAFTPAFFGQHAMRAFARAAATRRPISLIGVRLAPVTRDFADVAGGQTLNEAARLINRVTRAEDFAGRLTSDTFIVLANATVGSDAGIAARRIEGVIANTMFRSRVGRNLYAVAAASAAVERSVDQPLEETLAEALARLHSAPLRTAER